MGRAVKGRRSCPMERPCCGLERRRENPCGRGQWCPSFHWLSREPRWQASEPQRVHFWCLNLGDVNISLPDPSMGCFLCWQGERWFHAALKIMEIRSGVFPAPQHVPSSSLVVVVSGGKAREGRCKRTKNWKAWGEWELQGREKWLRREACVHACRCYWVTLEPWRHFQLGILYLVDTWLATTIYWLVHVVNCWD